MTCFVLQEIQPAGLVARHPAVQGGRIAGDERHLVCLIVAKYVLGCVPASHDDLKSVNIFRCYTRCRLERPDSELFKLLKGQPVAQVRLVTAIQIPRSETIPIPAKMSIGHAAAQTVYRLAHEGSGKSKPRAAWSRAVRRVVASELDPDPKPFGGRTSAAAVQTPRSPDLRGDEELEVPAEQSTQQIGQAPATPSNIDLFEDDVVSMDIISVAATPGQIAATTVPNNAGGKTAGQWAPTMRTKMKATPAAFSARVPAAFLCPITHVRPCTQACTLLALRTQASDHPRPVWCRW